VVNLVGHQPHYLLYLHNTKTINQTDNIAKTTQHNGQLVNTSLS
jgi:hypothetical protein